MVAHPTAFFNRLLTPLQRLLAQPARSPVGAPADNRCPLRHPDAPLPEWVAQDPVVQKYRTLLGDLPWATFPERPDRRPDGGPWSGPLPEPRVSFVAAYLVKLHEGKRYMADLQVYLCEHPALVYWLGFPRVPDPDAPHGFDVAATVPKRRRLSSVLRSLPNSSLQFLLTATVRLLQASLPQAQRDRFGDVIAGDTQGLLAWVKENHPKQFIKEGRLDKTRQPQGDPDCTLGGKARHNRAPSDEDHDYPAPTTDAKPVSQVQVGVDIFWGYASGVVTTRLPDGAEVVLAERTRPFNESDPSYFFPLMAQVEERLGRRPRFGAWDAACDAHYVYDYFHDAGGFAAVPFNPGGAQRAKRQFAEDGTPLCAAGLPMTLQFTYQHRACLAPHEREKFRCPLRHPEVTGAACPREDPHVASGGCTTTIARGAGSRLRHTLDREGERYKQLSALRTMVERINSQAEALHILHPKLRRGRAIVNHNTLTYVLINLRALARLRVAAEEVQPSEG